MNLPISYPRVDMILPYAHDPHPNTTFLTTIIIAPPPGQLESVAFGERPQFCGHSAAIPGAYMFI